MTLAFDLMNLMLKVDVNIIKINLRTKRMTFLGQGFKSYSRTRQTDRHTYRRGKKSSGIRGWFKNNIVMSIVRFKRELMYEI